MNTPNTPAGGAVKYAGPRCQACGRAFLYPKGCGCPAPTLIQSSLAHHPPRPSTVSADAVLALAAKWRERATREDEEGERYESDESATRLKLCADEAEALTREVRK